MILFSVSHSSVNEFLSIPTNEECTTAIRVNCGDQVTGSNLSTTPLHEVLNDCIAEDTSTYLGSLWYTFTGTGDSIHIIASAVKSTGSTNFIDLHVYEARAQICDSICMGGVYDVDETPGSTIGVQTAAGKEYFIMIGTFFNNDSSANIESFDLRLECICGDSPLSFSPPNNFASGDQYTFETDNTITADNVIHMDADITFNAAQGISLQPGFLVEMGATLISRQDGCAIPVKNAGHSDESKGESSQVFQLQKRKMKTLR
ncbi:MAG: hypothetical protein OEQ53_14300 [Saprospiraceae bacterium]|nr:hypothetical protein [Saprospiraceae bacterium]